MIGTFIFRYASRQNCTSIMMTLINAGAQLDHQDTDGFSALYMAIKNEHTDAVQLLLSKPDSGINVENKFGLTPLHEASKLGNTAIVGMLLFQSANVNAIDKWLNTPLMYATLHGHKNVVAFLLQSNCDVSKVNKGSRSALHTASRHGHTDIANMLIQAKADMDICDSDGNTSVLLAGKYRHYEIMKSLIHAGCNVHKRDSSGKTLFHYAAISGNQELVQILVSLQAAPDIPDENGNTPIMLAIRRNHLNIVRCFLHLNCNIQGFLFSAGVKSEPLHLALKHGYTEMIPILVRAGCSLEPFLALAGTPTISINIRNDTVLYSWLQWKASCPRRLIELCRIKLRGIMGTSNVEMNVNKLDIPQTLKQFLLFDDLDWGCAIE